MFGLLIRYGYRPWRALGWGLGVMILGALVFSMGRQQNIMTYMGPTNTEPTEQAQCLDFSAVTYSIDAFIPLVDFQIAKNWLPNPQKGDVIIQTKCFSLTTGAVVRLYHMFHVFMGWVLTSLLVLGLSGLVRS